MQQHKQPDAGTIIRGTHRLQDLIPAVMDVLREYSPDVLERYLSEYPIPADALLDESHVWWDSPAAQYTIEDFFEFMDDLAPDGHYFGAHPGDGSDFGFWSLELEDEA